MKFTLLRNIRLLDPDFDGDVQASDLLSKDGSLELHPDYWGQHDNDYVKNDKKPSYYSQFKDFSAEHRWRDECRRSAAQHRDHIWRRFDRARMREVRELKLDKRMFAALDQLQKLPRMRLAHNPWLPLPRTEATRPLPACVPLENYPKRPPPGGFGDQVTWFNLRDRNVYIGPRGYRPWPASEWIEYGDSK
jgi:hypothetical protein